MRNCFRISISEVCILLSSVKKVLLSYIASCDFKTLFQTMRIAISLRLGKLKKTTANIHCIFLHVVGVKALFAFRYMHSIVTPRDKNFELLNSSKYFTNDVLD